MTVAPSPDQGTPIPLMLEYDCIHEYEYEYADFTVFILMHEYEYRGISVFILMRKLHVNIHVI